MVKFKIHEKEIELLKLHVDILLFFGIVSTTFFQNICFSIIKASSTKVALIYPSTVWRAWVWVRNLNWKYRQFRHLLYGTHRIDHGYWMPWTWNWKSLFKIMMLFRQMNICIELFWTWIRLVFIIIELFWTWIRLVLVIIELYWIWITFLFVLSDYWSSTHLDTEVYTVYWHTPEDLQIHKLMNLVIVYYFVCILDFVFFMH